MRFDAHDLALLESIEEVRIETTAADGTVHRTIIWIVVDGDDVFLRSVNGAGARWYRETIAAGDVTVHAGKKAFAGRAEVAADDVSIERTSEALRRKYSADPALGSMLAPHTLATTLRFVPTTQG